MSQEGFEVQKPSAGPVQRLINRQRTVEGSKVVRTNKSADFLEPKKVVLNFGNIFNFPTSGTQKLSHKMVRNVKLIGDMMHLVSYPFLFWSLRHERRIGISMNSQMLFFLALLFRYSPVLTETNEMLDSVKVLSGLRGEHLSIDGLVHIYKKKHTTYNFLLRLVPLLASAAAVIRISMSYFQRERRDTLSWKV